MLLSFNRAFRYLLKKIEKLEFVDLFTRASEHMTGGGIKVGCLFLCDVGKRTYIAYKLLEYLPVMAQRGRSFAKIKYTHARSLYLGAAAHRRSLFSLVYLLFERSAGDRDNVHIYTFLLYYIAARMSIKKPPLTVILVQQFYR